MTNTNDETVKTAELKEFLTAFEQMRLYQVVFFKTHSLDALQKAKKYEAEADRRFKELSSNRLF